MAVDRNQQWANVESRETLVGRRTRFARFLGLHTDDPASSRGADGELVTGWWLGRLPDGWFAFHDVPVGRRGMNIDHLVIGPGGVFTIDTKNLSGEIVVASETLTHNGHRTDYLPKASGEARRAATLLSAAIGRPVEVRGLLAILADEWTIVERPADVFVGGPRGVKHWMLGRPTILRPSDVIVLAVAASRPGTWVGA